MPELALCLTHSKIVLAAGHTSLWLCNSISLLRGSQARQMSVRDLLLTCILS